MLGVYLGDPDFEQQSWEGVVAKVGVQLPKWQWLQSQLSYGGWVLVYLATSTLWHSLISTREPDRWHPETLVDFFWTGQHWIRAAAHLPMEEEGQELADIRSKMMSFRLQTVQRLLLQCIMLLEAFHDFLSSRCEDDTDWMWWVKMVAKLFVHLVLIHIPFEFCKCIHVRGRNLQQGVL